MDAITQIELVREKLLAGGVVVNIGGVDPAVEKQLNKWVKQGRLAKWRGRWFPVAGAPFGIGPLKTCWGLPEVRDHFETFSLGANSTVTP